jgi:hypothetical protein
MASDSDGGDGGFGWGVVVGLALGLAAGAYLASGPGRDRVESLRSRTIELTGNARRVAGDPAHPMRRVINEGINAARRRRQELERTAREAGGDPAGEPGEQANA